MPACCCCCCRCPSGKIPGCESALEAHWLTVVCRMLRAREEERKSVFALMRSEKRREKRARSTCPRATFMKTLCIGCTATTNKITIISRATVSLAPRSPRSGRLNYQRFPFCIADYLPRSPVTAIADKQRQRDSALAAESNATHVHPALLMERFPAWSFLIYSYPIKCWSYTLMSWASVPEVRKL